MVSRRRTVLGLFLPLAAYVACKGSSSDQPGDQAAGVDAGGGATVLVNDAGDSAGLADGGDGSLASSGSCDGNPLAASGAGLDGGVVIDGAGTLKTIATGPFLDGPQWIDDGAGAIVYSEVNAQTVVRSTPDGRLRTTLLETGGDLPIGNAQAGGFIFTAVSTLTGTGSIHRMLFDGGAPVTFSAAPANSPNDIVGSSKGILYFTDPAFQTTATNPVTGVYRMTLDGTVTPVQQFDAGANPGARAYGIALTGDDASLYVGFFDERRISKYTVDAAGVPTLAKPSAILPTDVPTGIAVDNGGNLWVAENDPVTTNIRGQIEVFDPAGKKWGEITLPDSRPTGIAFGGADRRTVYITTERDTALGTLYTYASRCSGVR